MSVELTEEQKRTLSARGRVVVSASAGSGKTFVMIERLVRLILGGADLKRVLAVTFTTKAAMQMKDRLRAALLDRIGSAEGEERARLKAQLSALPTADISTIHSLCARIVRSEFYLAGVDANFRILPPEDAEWKTFAARAMDETFEHFYEEDGAEFRRLLSRYYYKKKDRRLREIVASLHDAVRGRADYRTLLAEMGKKDGFEDAADYLAEDFRRRARFFSDGVAALGGRIGEGQAREVADQITAAAEQLISAPDLFAMRELTVKISNMPPMTKAEGDRLQALTRLSTLSAGIKELYKEFKKFASRETERSYCLDGQETARALAQLVLYYDEVFERLKREAGTLDYNDLEHCAIAILKNEEARTAIKGRYDYIFVDEYQDVNPAQEEILSLLSGEEVFLVGDAKQSIYGFRGSRSEYFLRKREEFGTALSLTENFRSSAAVLDAVNLVFSHAMTKESCGFSYAEEPMHGGRRYGEHDGKVIFHKYSKQPPEREERGIYTVLKEPAPRIDEQAERIAALIEQEEGSEWFDADTGLMKKLTFGDIAVLVRKKSGDAERVVSALGARGIPVTTAASVNVLDYWEARLVVDFLSYLDNPEQDIPLAGALLSRIGGFTEAELLAIRNRFPAAYSFRAACKSYIKVSDPISDKLQAFYEKTERYRAFLRVRTAAEMIDLLLSEGLEAEIAAKRDGNARLARVRHLASFTGDSSTGEFLRRLKTLGNVVKYSPHGGDGAVKVLTVHAAKGLEFPVVILASLDVPFHGPDRDDVLYSDKFLFAPKSFDLAEKVTHETLLRRATDVYCGREEIKGELNILYVAMTRAKCRLHLFVKERKPVIAPQYAKRFADFFDFTAFPDCFQEEEPCRRTPLPRNAYAANPDEGLLSSVRSVYRQPYPHAGSVALPVKSSATDLLRREREERPFAAGGGAAGTAEEGLAYHAFLQHADFSLSAAENLQKMTKEGTLPEARLALLDEKKLGSILALPSVRALKGKRVWRERTFLVSLPARDIRGLGSDEEDPIVVQGAIDLLAEDEEGYLILDYKYSAHDAERLKADYRDQLALYRKAVSVILGVAEHTVRTRIVNLMGLYETDIP